MGCSDIGDVQDTSKKSSTKQETEKDNTDINNIKEEKPKTDDKTDEVISEPIKPKPIEPEKPYKNPFQPSTEIDPNTPKYIEPIPEKKEYLNGRELKILPNIISTDLKLTKNIYWQISGNVKVKTGVKFEIEAGTEIFGADASSKIEFQNSSKLIAIGKKNLPIIFTSKNHILGKESTSGEWGGISLVNNDGSILKYIQILYSGHNQPALKLENMNYSNIFEFIEIAFSNSDGVQISGGEINLRNSIILGANGDGLSVKNGWKGKFQNIYIHQFNGIFGEMSSGLEVGSDVKTTITNLTINSDSEKVGAGIFIRENAEIHLINSIISGKRAGVCIKAKSISENHKFEYNILNCQNGGFEKVKLDKSINTILSENTSLEILSKKVEPINPYSINGWFDEYSNLYIGSFDFTLVRKWSDGWTFGMEEIFNGK